MTFVNPAFFAGLLILGAPLLIHMMTRRTPVRLTFPTIQFLKRAKASQSRIFRIRHWLMLALRTLALLLLILAFLRPEYRARALVQQPSGEGGHAVVVVLDCSMSMGYAAGGFSPFAKAKAAVETVLSDLRAGDVANVVLMDAHPAAVLEAPAEGMGLLIQAVQGREVSLARGDVDSALELAVKQLQEQDAEHRELHIVSDFQRANWASANFGAVPEGVKTVFISVGDEEASNGAITSVEVNPAYPALGERVTATINVANYSDAPRTIPVSVVFDGEEAPEREVSVAPRSTASVTMGLPIERPGHYEGAVSIPKDALPADDVRHFTVSAAERTGVLIVSDELPTGGVAAQRILLAALDPLEGARTGFAPRAVRASAFDASTAGAARVAVVAEVGPFSESIAKELLAFVKGGGGLLYFLCGPADGDNLRLLEAQAAEDGLTLPFVTGRFVEGDDAPPAAFQQANYDHAILKKFRESGALATLHFTRYYETQRREAQGQILLRYDNGHTGLASTTYGLGSILLANFTPTPAGGDLTKQLVFLPLLHEMCEALRPQGSGAREHLLGELASTTVTLPSADAPLRITAPGGSDISAGIDINGSEGSVILATTEQAGFYRVYSGATPLGAMAVNVDARESDLAPLSVPQLEDLAQLGQEQFIAQAGVDAENLRRLREGVPMWHWFALALCVALALEQLVAWRWLR